MNLEEIASLAELLDRTSLTEITWTHLDSKVVLRKGSLAPAPALIQAPAVVAPVAAPAAAPASPPPAAAAVAPAPAAKPLEIKSPMVGTYYKSPSPDAAPFLQVGSRVDKGQVIAIVEAMKLMNEIESDIAGTVVEVCVENESPVEYGTVLYRVQP